MTTSLFHEISDAQIVLRSRGVYRQVKLFRRGDGVYAAWGSGFIRLLRHSGTTVPTISYDIGSLYDPYARLCAQQGQLVLT